MLRFLTRSLSMSLLLGCCFQSCDRPEQAATDGPSEMLKAAKGGRNYGGIFNLNEPEYIKNLFPHSIIDAPSYRVASQIYEGLFKFDQNDLTVVKCLVEDYTVDDSKTVYTFTLKDDVYFHDSEIFDNGKGRKMTADDVIYCFKLLSTQHRNNQAFNLLSGVLKGADTFYAKSANGTTAAGDISGMRKIDNRTVEMTLTRPNSMFLYNLARPGTFIFPREAYERYGVEMRIRAVGTGPYMLQSVDEDIQIILKKNPNYHGVDQFGNRLPFLDAISIRFLPDKKVELLEFKKGNLDMMYRLPTDYIIEILAETNSDGEGGYNQYDLKRTPEMSSQILVFQNQDGIFKDVNVRKAFSFAINRETILDYVLSGEGYMTGDHGITPPVFPNYDITDIKGYKFNLDSARFFLRQAGFPNGEGFPRLTLDLNSEGDRYTNVALEVQKQLRDNLGIEIDLQIYPLAQITEKAQSGDFNLLRLAWIADYPSPENYLWMTYGKNLPNDAGEKSYPNIPRYSNRRFDQYYEAAITATSTEEAFENFKKAEKLLMRDAPFLVLWYDEGYRLTQSYVKNFPNNPMQYRNFGEVYFVEKTAAQ